MRYALKNTLEAILKMPQRECRDVSGVLVRDTMSYYQHFKAKYVSEVAAEYEAVAFYAMNQLCAAFATQGTPLLPWQAEAAELYKTILTEQHARLTLYMALIVQRESRHVQLVQPLQDDIEKKWGKECLMFQKDILGSSSIATANKVLSDKGTRTMGQLADVSAYTFEKGKFGASFGGKPWHNIAVCLQRMIHGETSGEVFVDTAYTLAHNNGPIFNKGMLYTGYDPKIILEILDCQRAGQAAQYLTDTPTLGFYDPTIQKVRNFVKIYFESNPHVTRYVNWFDVEKLGAVGNCKAKQAEQVKKHGKPVALLSKNAKGHQIIGTYEVDHELTVNLLKLNRKAA